ncbi:ATP-binding protein [Lacinutrix sp. Bg11-31]|uniref:ATP-binding protein n=1 Tax=Lacinutrix sp. Bg11-31 TaxID=2057808 RepID=UPI000C30F98B|nr:hypothetical protein CW733_09795 [Lacinutrix sp. Bg11-31]
MIENKVDESLLVIGILLNFLTNCRKYKSDERQYKITLSEKVKNEFVLLTITDSGLGIDLELYEDRLFSLYETFHNHIDSKGLGLFITKNQIESLGGKVTVKSVLNQGTSFNVYLKEA